LRVVDLEDGKLSDLAQQASITEENAAVRVHRARKALRRQVEQACGTCAEHGCIDCHCNASKRSQCEPLRLRPGK
jgi:RNA polymerase sigma-70 factor (ECF subfamily)